MRGEPIAVADRVPAPTRKPPEYVRETALAKAVVDHPESIPRDKEATAGDTLRPIAQVGLKRHYPARALPSPTSGAC